MEKYLGGEEPNYDALHAPFERAMDEGHVVPILFTDAKNGVGIAGAARCDRPAFPQPTGGQPAAVSHRDRRRRAAVSISSTTPASRCWPMCSR